MEGNEPLPVRTVRKKDPCRKQQIDFHLCEKKYGFNDQYCKYYLEEFENCARKHAQFYHN